jgi:hypothetical protein
LSLAKEMKERASKKLEERFAAHKEHLFRYITIAADLYKTSCYVEEHYCSRNKDEAVVLARNWLVSEGFTIKDTNDGLLISWD